MIEKFSQKWVITAFFDELPPGFEFATKNDPLHITLADVFAININGKRLFSILKKILEGADSFYVTAGSEADFGLKGETRVVLINPSNELHALHEAIFKMLIKNGAVFNNPQFQSDGYHPHSTIQKSGRLYTNQRVKIDKLSLVDMFPDGDGLKRRVKGTIQIGNLSE